MVSSLKRFGIKIQIENDQLRVQGQALKLPNKTIEPKEAGTTTRFIMALCTLVSGRIIITPSGSMRTRPIEPLIQSLAQLNVSSKCLETGQSFPLQLTSTGIFDGVVVVDANVSSQFLSALLLISPFCQRQLTIRVRGKQVSKPYSAQTLAVMKRFGVGVKQPKEDIFIIQRQAYRSLDRFFVEPDASAASYFFAHATIFKKNIRMKHLSLTSIQGDSHFPKVLAKMGAKIFFSREFIQVSGAPLQGIRVRLNDMPDLVQTLGVIALFARGETKITGVANLQYKETDRLQSLATELRKMGAAVWLGSDFIRIVPPEKLPQNAIFIETYGDHRMAMAFGVLTSRYKNIRIQNRSCVKKSMPSFWKILNSLQTTK
jgi:3-phosphoshikimate 1-carboxyvinyltransferase